MMFPISVFTSGDKYKSQDGAWRVIAPRGCLTDLERAAQLLTYLLKGGHPLSENRKDVLFFCIL